LDPALGIVPVPRIVKRGRRRAVREFKLKDVTFAGRRLKKWPIFLDLAVARFRLWFNALELDMAKASPSTECPHLPPLDILMVWHSFLLNPTMFKKYCDEHRMTKVQSVAFPWLKIHNAINQSDWTYSLTPEDSSHVLKTANLAPDLYAYLINLQIPIAIRLFLQRYGAVDAPLSAENVQIHRPRGQHPSFHNTFVQCCATAVSGTNINTELANAVVRQFSFVEKMEKQLWIRSPAVQGTLQRATGRYGKFLRLLKLYPKTMLVPTLDIDLVWHTHQCSHAVYVAATEVLAGRFIDHDDKLETFTLDNGMEKTKNLYRIRFGQEYSICNCWECEAMLSAIEALDNIALDANKVAQTVEKEVTFHRAVELERRNRDVKLVW
jgi:hypothetical protein